MASFDLALKFVKSNVGLIIIYLIINLLTFVLETIGLSKILGKVFDKIGSKDLNLLRKLFIWLAIVFGLTKLGHYLINISYSYFIPKFNAFIKEGMFKMIVDRYQQDFQELRLGYVLSNLQEIPYALYSIIEDIVSTHISNIIALLVTVGYIFYINKKIGIIAIIGIIIGAIYLFLSSTKAINLSTTEHKQYQNNNEHVQDKLGNLFSIYTSSTESEEVNTYGKMENQLAGSLQNSLMYSSHMIGIVEIISTVVFLIVMKMIYDMHKNGAVSKEQMITILLLMTYYTSYITTIASRLSSLLDLIGSIKQGDKFFKSLEPTSTGSDTFKGAENLPDISITNGSISIRGVSFKYSPKPEEEKSDTEQSEDNKDKGKKCNPCGEKSRDKESGDSDELIEGFKAKKNKVKSSPQEDVLASEEHFSGVNKEPRAERQQPVPVSEEKNRLLQTMSEEDYIIKNLNCFIRPKTVVALCGQSGCGKTTLLKLILGFYKPSIGSILIDNTDITTINPQSLREQISVVDQNVKLFDSSVLENILYGIDPKTASESTVKVLLKQTGLAKVFARLEKGLDTLVGTNGSNLSRGQRQVIVIMRGILKNKKIMILDEPTSALDKNTKKCVLDALSGLDRTIIIITHDPEVLGYVNVAYSMKDGRLEPYSG